MIKIFYAFLLAVVLWAMPVFAQDAEPSAVDIIAKVKTDLNLTEGQISEVGPIIEKYSSATDKLREDLAEDSNDKDNIRRQMKELKEDEAQELSQFLNEDQVSQWRKMARDWNNVSEDDSTEVTIKPIDQSTPPFERRTAE